MKTNKIPGMFIDVGGSLIEVTDFKKAFQSAKSAIAWNKRKIKGNSDIIFPKALNHWKKVFIALEKLGVQHKFSLDYSK